MYIQDLLERKEEWSVCYRKEMPVRGSHTNNYVEAQFLVLKVKAIYIYKGNIALLHAIYKTCSVLYYFQLYSIQNLQKITFLGYHSAKNTPVQHQCSFVEII